MGIYLWFFEKAKKESFINNFKCLAVFIVVLANIVLTSVIQASTHQTLSGQALSKLVHDRGMVWKISRFINGQQQSIYIGGTIHLLATNDYPLPDVFEQAYQESDIVVFEVDAKKMQEPSFQGLMIQKATYQNGATLKSTLSSQTYATLEQFLKNRGGDIQTLSQFKPGMLSILLLLDELQRLGQMGEGVDEFFDRRARADNKPMLFLETVSQQLDFLAKMGEGYEDHLILYTLDEIDQLPLMMAELKQAWRQGDQQQLEKVALIPWQTDFPDTYQSLLVDRNKAWLPVLDAFFDTEAREYVLVGALHLVGQDGLLAMLRHRGYQVEQLGD